MSNQITLSTGALVTIKSFVSRGTRKKINAALDVSINDEGKIGAMKMQSIDHSRDVAAVELIEKIEINGETKKATLEFLDGLSVADFNLIAGEINKLEKEESTPLA